MEHFLLPARPSLGITEYKYAQTCNNEYNETRDAIVGLWLWLRIVLVGIYELNRFIIAGRVPIVLG